MLRGEQKFLLAATLILLVGVFLMVTQVGNPKPVSGLSLSGARTGQGLLVTGHGQVRVPADVARVQAGIVGSGQSVSQAQSNALAKVKALRRALSAAGLGKVAVQVEKLSIDGTPAGSGHFGSDISAGPFEVAYGLTLTTSDVSGIGRLSDTVLGAGAVVIEVEYGLQDVAKARDAAMEAAAKDAAQKARSVAQSLGVSLAGVRYVGDGSIALDTQRLAGASGIADGTASDWGSVQSDGGDEVEVQVRAVVQVEYGL